MKKKHKKKVVSSQKSGATGEAKKEPELSLVDHRVEEKPFDFGGLPDRKLKKNLGCG